MVPEDRAPRALTTLLSKKLKYVHTYFYICTYIFMHLWTL